MKHDTGRLEADATAFLHRNGIDAQGERKEFDPARGDLVKLPRQDAFTAGSFPPGADLDILATAPLDDFTRPSEGLAAVTRMQRHLRLVAYLADMLSSAGEAEERSERGQRLLELAESREHRDILAATIYRDLDGVGVPSAKIVERLCGAMACSPASAYARVQRGNQHMREGVVAFSDELPSACLAAPRPKANIQVATRRTRYSGAEWQGAIERMPASMRYDFIHHLVKQAVTADLAIEDAGETRLKMIPHRVDGALEALGINSIAVRRLLGAMTEQDRDAWLAKAYANVVKADAFGTTRQRVESRDRATSELFERHVKQVLRPSPNRSGAANKKAA